MPRSIAGLPKSTFRWSVWVRRTPIGSTSANVIGLLTYPLKPQLVKEVLVYGARIGLSENLGTTVVHAETDESSSRVSLLSLPINKLTRVSEAPKVQSC